MIHHALLLPPTGITVPVVAHVPHAGTWIPQPVRRTLALDDVELKTELARITDWHANDLFHGVLELGGALFVNRLSRIVVDPERFEDDAQEPAAAFGFGAVYTRTTSGRDLRPGFHEGAREATLAAYYRPCARAFRDAVDAILETFGRCVIIDGHTYPSRALPFEVNPDSARPDICIGTDPYHTPPEPVAALEQSCVRLGRTVAVDGPFSGTYVPAKHYRTDPRLASVMIEVRRDLYCDERTGERTPRYGVIRKEVDALLDVGVRRTQAR